MSLNTRVAFGSLILAIGCSASANAATIDVSVPHGNEAGCAAVNGAYPHSDEKLILRADSIEGYESYCEFVQVLKSKSGTAVTSVVCGGEGETWLEHVIVSPADPENGDRRQVFHGSGNLWGEVAPCE